MRLVKVISGGQTGVDIAALRAAKAHGIATGGWMPKGWKTLDGDRPEYAHEYGMREASSREYSARTFANVTDGHATLRIASAWSSPGELCTLRWLTHAQRPFRDVSLHPDPSGSWYAPHLIAEALGWLLSFDGDVVLNVAGNSERTAPGIERTAEAYLRRLFADVVVATRAA